MEITVNGDCISIAQETSVVDLIGKMNLQGARVAIEINREIIPRSQHASRRLEAGDRVEIVQAIGGG